jgi:hypothetical protein
MARGFRVPQTRQNFPVSPGCILKKVGRLIQPGFRAAVHPGALQGREIDLPKAPRIGRTLETTPYAKRHYG